MSFILPQKTTLIALPRKSTTTSVQSMASNSPNNSLNLETVVGRPDEFSRTTPVMDKELLPVERNKIIHDAKIRAALWSGVFAEFSTIFYALRNTEALAQKRPEVQTGDMSLQEARKLEEDVKWAQLKASIPSLIPGVGFLSALGYLVLEKPEDPNFNKFL